MDITAQRWRTLRNVRVLDILRTIGELVERGHAVHIGTDAQKATRFTDFVVVACLLSPERQGHRVFYTRLRKRRMSLHQKLFWETWLSTEFALRLCEVGSVDSHDRVHVHIDVNPSAVHKSSRYLEQLAGLVVGQGFPVLYKPEAWAASRAADHAVKGKHWKAREVRG
ncbi:MAG: ribonuclease H-like YkuK family protein [Myxococcota bacterium]|nr:ribonuclease H-like YkuK family protein [Myxococcota bacterium]